MSTLRIRASHIPEAWPQLGFTRVVQVLDAVIDIFAEAQEMARSAQKRCPFVEG
jgi:hypothetical protein